MHWTVLFWFYIILVSENLGALFHRSIFLIYYLFIFCRKYSFLLKCHYYCLKINALKNLKEIMNTRCFWWVFDTLNYIMQEYFFAWLKSKLYALDIFFWFYIILVKKNLEALYLRSILLFICIFFAEIVFGASCKFRLTI